ncbi:MAG: cobalt-precorrin-6A reductase [Hyphomicrobiales bacterium]|nr:cobalt-precorrin-6A reductase [Hyphomicrobiales bacterium]
MDKPFKIMILGGTRNARDLAIALASNAAKTRELDIITSLAGRTSEPDRTFGKIRVGGFGGASGLAEYLVNEKIDLLVDSTHPFASQISQNALVAANSTGVERLVLDRPKWEKQAGDNWIDCDNLDEAARILPAGARAFLALGHQYLHRFSHREDVNFIARMINRPKTGIPLKNHELVLAKPSHVASEEADLLKQYNTSHLVCRNSGGGLIYAKIEAARLFELPVLMIKRPPAVSGKSFGNIKALEEEVIRLSA